MQTAAGVIRVALVNDYEIVVTGLLQLLRRYPEQLEVVELDCLADPTQPVDLVLYDVFAPARSEVAELSRLAHSPLVGRVVVYTWDTDPDHARAALAAGASGYLSKSLDADELADALVRVHSGEVVVGPLTEAEVPDEERDAPAPGRDWPGRAEGLSTREAEVIGLITQGKTNAEIARQLYLSPNSIKTYIRAAYRKIGVERRSQAVAWGYEHGMAPEVLVRKDGGATTAPGFAAQR